MKPIPLILVAVAIVIIAPFIYMPFVETSDPQLGDLPWQIEVADDGTARALGFTLGASTLGDARARYGEELEIAIVTPKDGKSSLEGYNGSAKAGFITGRLVVTADLPAQLIAAMRERAVKTEFMESTTRKATLHPEDLPAALAAPIAALGFIPTANLDAPTILERFGEPAERFKGAGQQEHFLYPALGLGITLDPDGKELLQYVAPRDFERLRAPLLATRQDAAAGEAPPAQ